MKRHDDEGRAPWERIADGYNRPPPTPRKEMWDAIEARLGTGETASASEVHDLAERRRREGGPGRAPRTFNRGTGWAVAAAVVLVMGIGIGRITAPDAGAPRVASAPAARDNGVDVAAREHLGNTESLLTMVRADARDGRVDPAVAAWADDLLSQTRLLLDTREGLDPAVRDLLLDLELVLVQVAGAAETESMDNARARTEMELTLRSMEQGEVLPRIQAALPAGMAGA